MPKAGSSLKALWGKKVSETTSTTIQSDDHQDCAQSNKVPKKLKAITQTTLINPKQNKITRTTDTITTNKLKTDLDELSSSCKSTKTTTTLATSTNPENIIHEISTPNIIGCNNDKALPIQNAEQEMLGKSTKLSKKKKLNIASPDVDNDYKSPTKKEIGTDLNVSARASSRNKNKPKVDYNELENLQKEEEEKIEVIQCEAEEDCQKENLGQSSVLGDNNNAYKKKKQPKKKSSHKSSNYSGKKAIETNANNNGNKKNSKKVGNKSGKGTLVFEKQNNTIDQSNPNIN
eukprot:Pgem_evm1s7471